VQWATGVLEWREGNLDAAREQAMAALAGERELRRGLCVAYSLELLCWVAAAEGALQEAGRLQGAARAVWNAMGIEVGYGPAVQAETETAVRYVTKGLGEARCEQLLAEQAGISIDDALALALRGRSAGTGEPPAAPADALDPLSTRESEVADLIAGGKSNKAIAEALIVSPRTVDGHVERILAKLGFQSRTQVAAWVSERRHATTH
jgi:DNA-binding CsgD family transcriptional regulator